MPDSEIQQHDGVQLVKFPFPRSRHQTRAPTQGGEGRGAGGRGLSSNRELSSFSRWGERILNWCSPPPWGSLYIGGEGGTLAPPPREGWQLGLGREAHGPTLAALGPAARRGGSRLGPQNSNPKRLFQKVLSLMGPKSDIWPIRKLLPQLAFK